MYSSQTTDLLETQQPLHIEIEKKTLDTQHVFACTGVTCTSYDTILNHLSFDHSYIFTDETSVPFSGTVTIAGTGENNFDSPCPLSGVRVCLLRNHSVAKIELACRETDSRGEYRLPALLGLNVEVSFDYLNHTFSRVNEGSTPSYFAAADGAAVYVIDDEVLWNNVDYEDFSTAALTVEAAGGHCNRILGQSVIHLVLPSCPSADPDSPGEPYTREVLIEDRFSQTWHLPAHNIAVRLQEVAKRPIVAKYLAQVDQRTQLAELENKEPSLIRFEFHPPPTLSVRFDGAASSACSNAPTILRAHTPTKATITIEETFSDSPLCVW